MMNACITLIENDQSLIMGRNYIQELYLQLHLFDVFSTLKFLAPLTVEKSASASNGISVWEMIPSVVCITLKVSRSILKGLTHLPSTELLTPPVQCLLRSPNTSRAGAWDNRFAAVQLSFGDVRTIGSRDYLKFGVDVAGDKRG